MHIYKYVPNLYDPSRTPKYGPHPWLPKQLRLPGTKTSSRCSLGPLPRQTGSSTSCTMVGFGWSRQWLEELCCTAGPCVWLGTILYTICYSVPTLRTCFHDATNQKFFG